jgi:hypothetical protein
MTRVAGQGTRAAVRIELPREFGWRRRPPRPAGRPSSIRVTSTPVCWESPKTMQQHEQPSRARNCRSSGREFRSPLQPPGVWHLPTRACRYLVTVSRILSRHGAVTPEPSKRRLKRRRSPRHPRPPSSPTTSGSTPPGSAGAGAAGPPATASNKSSPLSAWSRRTPPRTTRKAAVRWSAYTRP